MKNDFENDESKEYKLKANKKNDTIQLKNNASEIV